MAKTKKQKALDEELIQECEGYHRSHNKPDGAYLLERGRFYNTNKIKRLIEKGADVRVKDRNGNTPLHVAIWMGDETFAKLLIDSDAKVNAKGEYGSTSLHFAVCWDNIAIAKLLIASGADVGAKNKGGFTPLHLAHDLQIINALIKAGAKVNAKNNIGNTPLHKLNNRDKSNLGKAELLIRAGADVNAENLDGETPLLLSYSHVELRKLLKEHGAVIIKI